MSGRRISGGAVDEWLSGELIRRMLWLRSRKRSLIAVNRGKRAPVDSLNVAIRMALNVRVASSGCWEWRGSFGTTHYGTMRVGGVTMSAHRVSFEVAHGVAIGAACVLHQCDNRKCVNPNHLRLGDRHDNMREASERGRLKPPRCSLRGSRNGGAKLSESDVHEIRRMRAKNESRAAVAARFGVSIGSIASIDSGRNWGWLEVL